MADPLAKFVKARPASGSAEIAALAGQEILLGLTAVKEQAVSIEARADHRPYLRAEAGWWEEFPCLRHADPSDEAEGGRPH